MIRLPQAVVRDRGRSGHRSHNDHRSRTRSSHRNTSHPRNMVHRQSCRNTNPRIDLAQDFARGWRALIFSSGNATSKCTHEKKDDGRESTRKKRQNLVETIIIKTIRKPQFASTLQKTESECHNHNRYEDV